MEKRFAGSQKVLQRLISQFVLERDKDYPCISCGRRKSVKKWDAGHFIDAKVASMRYNLFNVHRQCANCNGFAPKAFMILGYQSGLQYRIRLLPMRFFDSNRCPSSYYFSETCHIAEKEYGNVRAKPIKKSVLKEACTFVHTLTEELKKNKETPLDEGLLEVSQETADLLGYVPPIPSTDAQ